MRRVQAGLRDPGAAVHHLFRRRYGWTQGGVVKRRAYASYDDYLQHQRSKLDRRSSDWLKEFERDYPAILAERIRRTGALTQGMNVVCLAARLGTEVRAFHSLGCFAVGVDLNPGPDNKYVVTGDFHALQFPDGCVDAVFSNALDHAFDLEKVISEIRRVLRPGAAALIELVNGEDEGYQPGYYEAAIWKRVGDVVAAFVARGFEERTRVPFEYPWRGQLVWLTRRD